MAYRATEFGSDTLQCRQLHRCLSIGSSRTRGPSRGTAKPKKPSHRIYFLLALLQSDRDLVGVLIEDGLDFAALELDILGDSPASAAHD